LASFRRRRALGDGTFPRFQRAESFGGYTLDTQRADGEGVNSDHEDAEMTLGKKPIPLGYQPKKKPHSGGWGTAIAVIVVCIVGMGGHFRFHWEAASTFWFIVLGSTVVGIPAGIKYGTQNKDYWA
jgi:hypothetical protein